MDLSFHYGYKTDTFENSLRAEFNLRVDEISHGKLVNWVLSSTFSALYHVNIGGHIFGSLQEKNPAFQQYMSNAHNVWSGSISSTHKFYEPRNFLHNNQTWLQG